MNYSSKLIKPYEGIIGTSNLYPDGQKYGWQCGLIIDILTWGQSCGAELLNCGIWCFLRVLFTWRYLSELHWIVGHLVGVWDLLVGGETSPPSTHILIGTVSELLGPYNKIPYKRWLKQQKFISLQFWRLEVQNQSTAWLFCGETSVPVL